MSDEKFSKFRKKRRVPINSQKELKGRCDRGVSFVEESSNWGWLFILRSQLPVVFRRIYQTVLADRAVWRYLQVGKVKQPPHLQSAANTAISASLIRPV